MSVRLTVNNHGTVKIHFNSRLSRLLGWRAGLNNCAVTLSATHIFVARDSISRMTLAHEFGHVNQAKIRGVLYLPWVVVGFLIRGYVNNVAEKEADLYMWKHFRDFPASVHMDGTVIP